MTSLLSQTTVHSLLRKSSDDGGEEQEAGLSRKGTNFVGLDSERLDKSLSGSADMSGKVDARRARLRQIIKQFKLGHISIILKVKY